MNIYTLFLKSISFYIFFVVASIYNKWIECACFLVYNHAATHILVADRINSCRSLMHRHVPAAIIIRFANEIYITRRQNERCNIHDVQPCCCQMWISPAKYIEFITKHRRMTTISWKDYMQSIACLNHINSRLYRLPVVSCGLYTRLMAWLRCCSNCMT